MGLMDRLLSMGEGRKLRALEDVAKQVNLIEPDYEAMSDEELRAQTDEFRQQLAAGESLDAILPFAFATVREATRRVLGKRPYDVQVIGGVALHRGNIAEMKTGEGKTIVALMPSYLNALEGKGVHIVTVNDYLAQYQSEQMGRVHHFLGLEVGVILSSMTPPERRQAYAADITYGTNNEFGFDYLRDNMASSLDECVQRGHHYAIVDEVDSILIDEARTPLIISGPAEDNHQWYPEFAKLATSLVRDTHYEVDEKKRTISILEPGITVVEDRLGIENLYESANTPLISYLNNAIKAKELFKRDKDYVVMDGEVLIVDEHTGRMLPGRRYNEGMHQAIEAKEGVEIKNENQTLATITLQNYFRMYSTLSGMTGTAMTEAAELNSIYKLGVVEIPTNMPMIRMDQADLVYRTEDAKYAAVVDDIVERHRRGQPVLVGTVSVEKSEHLAELLRRRGVRHEVLNAKQHAREAAIVAEAGRRGAVTVATNMAGRGTDIMLGGNSEFRAIAELKRQGLDPVETPDEYEAAWAQALTAAEGAVASEHDEVVGLGGLYVLGTERHESRRIDNQLRGRSGRQGDPGESRFYLSLQDDLMRLFNGAMVDRFMQTARMEDDVPIESKMVSRSIASAQSQVEGRNYEIRKNVLKYDDVMNRQRTVIYDERRRVLMGADIHEQVRLFINDVVEGYVDSATAEGFPETWDLDQLWTAIGTLFPCQLTLAEVEAQAGGRARLTAAHLKELLTSEAHHAYDAREASVGEETMRELERRVILSVLDRRWREHLYEMDYLQEGIGLRAMAQRDPLVEYQREGFDLFNAMMEAIKEEAVGYLYNVEVQVEQAPPTPAVEPMTVQQLLAGAAGAGGVADAVDAGAARPGVQDAAVEHAHPTPPAPPAEPTGPAVPNTFSAPGLTPGRPQRLHYSAPSADGGVVEHDEGTAQTRAAARRTSKKARRRGK